MSLGAWQIPLFGYVMKNFTVKTDDSSEKFIILCTVTRSAILLKSRRKPRFSSQESLHHQELETGLVILYLWEIDGQAAACP